jgi:threonyl-tRNA synthetase
LEIIEGLQDAETLSIYRHGDFVDLCQGPHVGNTGDIPAVKLLNVACAYWRGDEGRPMLQRIYGTAFESREQLDEHLARLEEAEKRDHRLLGRQLGLFTVHEEIGPGLIVWHPKGGQVRTIIEDYWRELHYRRGYDIVYSPHIGRGRLWQTSGHLDFYRESMYAALEVDDQEYFLKPMNCPFHIMIYRSTLRSYRELPLRFAELGTVYRYERSGVLHGLMRVRGFTQDDAHIFCQPDQVETEVGGVLDLTFELLDAFGFADYGVSLSTRPDKYVGDPEMWDHATGSLRTALEQRHLAFEVDEGGGAFYGPKIDINITDALGRAWQCTTVQFDFNLPERFDLTFQDAGGGRSRPYMVHRAVLGSMERFLGVLIEHYGGAFPLWLAPVQASVIPIADRHLEYAQQVQGTLTGAGFRVEVDGRSERMNLKIRNAQMMKVPYMLVVGDREMEAGAVAVRQRDGEDLGAMKLAVFLERLKQEAKS